MVSIILGDYPTHSHGAAFPDADDSGNEDDTPIITRSSNIER